MSLRAISDDAAAAARNLRRHPRNPILLALVISVAIGSLLGIFDCARQILRGGLPFRDPASIVLGDRHSSEFLVSAYNWRPNPRASEVFGELAEFHLETDILDSPSPRSLLVAYVTPNFFATLGVHMALGTDLPNAAAPAPGAHLDWLPAVISQELWRNGFGADPHIIGREFATKLLYPYRFLVVGVAPPGATFPRGVDAWVPEHLWSMSVVQTGATPNWVETAVARLRPGITAAQAEAAIRTWPRNTFLWTWAGSARLIPLRAYLGGDFYRLAPMLWLLTVLFLALVIAATVSIWGRGFDDQREAFSVRKCLGATPGRLLRSRCLELAAALGAALSLAILARAAILRLTLHAVQLPLASPAAVSPADLGLAAAAIGLIVALIGAREARGLGAVPRLRRIRSNAAHEPVALRPAGRLRLPATLVTASIILVTALVLARSAYLASRIDPGLRPGDAFVCDLALPLNEDAAADRGVNPALPETQRSKLVLENLLRFHRQVSFEFSLIAEQIQGRAEVAAAGVISATPYSGYPPTGADVSISAAPGPPQPKHYHFAHIAAMTAGAIPALGMKLIYGQNFRGAEGADHDTAIVNQAMARLIAPGAGCLGLYLTLAYPQAPSMRIVGVVGDVHESNLFAPVVPTVYVPFSDYAPSNADLVLRGRSSISYAEAYSTIQSAVRSVAPGAVLTRFRSLSEMVGSAEALTRYTASFLAALAGLGLFLVAVCAWAESTGRVRRREHEIGIRLALGAENSRLAWSMAARDLAPSLLAVCLGALIAYWLSGLLGFLFHGTRPVAGDFILGAALIEALASLASIAALRRAIRRTPSDLISKRTL